MSDTPQRKKEPSARRGLRWKRWVLPPLAVIFVISAAVFFLTATGPGLRLALQIAEGPVSELIEGEFSVENPSGSLWSEVRIGRLEMSMPDGLAVEGRKISLAWRPGALFGGRLVVDAVGADQLSVSLPDDVSQDQRVEEEAETFAIPHLPVRVIVRQLAFPSVAISIPDGSQYRMSILGDVATSETGEIRTTIDVAADLNGRPVDRVGLRASVTPGDAPVLSTDLSAEFPIDGVLHAVLDLPAELRRQLSVSVSGTGLLSDWSGEVHLAAQGIAGLNGKVGLGVTDAGIHVSYDGMADFEAPDLFGLPPGLAGSYAIAVPDLSIVDDVLAVSDIRVAKDGLAAITVSARMTLDATDLTADGNIVLDPGAAALADLPIAFQAAQIDFQASATLPTVKADVKISAQDIDGAGNTVGGLAANLSASGALDQRIALTADVTAERVGWSDEALRQLVGKTVKIRARAELDSSFQAVDAIDVSVDPLGVTLQTALKIDGSTLIADTVQADFIDLARLEPVLGMPIAGSASVLLSGLSVSEDGTVSTVFEVGAKGLSIIDDQVTGLVGPSPGAKGDLLLSAADGLAVTLHDVRARAGAVTAVVILTPDFGELSGSINAKALASALAADMGLSVDGDVIELNARFAGAIAQPDLDAVVKPFAAAISGTDLQVQAMEAQLRWRDDAPFVTFQGAGSAMGLSASVEGGAAIRPDGLDVPGVSVMGEGWSAWAAARLPDFALPADGAARVVVSDASPFTALAGLHALAGRATLDLEFSAAEGGNGQAVAAKVSAEQIAVAADGETPPVTVERLDATADIGDALALRDIDASVAIKNVVGEGFHLSEIDTVLHGTGEAVEGDVTIAGIDPTPLSLTSRISARVQQDGQGELQLTELRFGYAGLDPLASGKVGASFGPGSALSGSLDMAILSGALTAEYVRDGGAASLSLDASDIPVGPLAELQGQPGVEGLLNAKADLRQDNGPTGGGFTLSASGLRTKDLDKDVSVGVTVSGDIADGRVRVQAKTAGTGLDKIDIRGEVPVALSLVEPGATVNPDGSLDGIVKVEIQLREIWPYLPLPEHRAAGLMAVDARLGGTFAHPSVQGDAALRDVEYEHLVHGTIIRNIQGRVRFAGEDFVLEGLSGQDDYGGSFNISGNGSLAGGAPTFDIATKLNTLRVVNSDAVKADVDADINARQQADGMLVKGGAVIRRAEINLGVALPPSIATLDVEDGSETPAAFQEEANPSGITLDISVDAPGQVFVRGRGLESEWEGKVKISGTADKPIVSGGLAARRGRIDVIGKGFTLDDSKIQFFGGETIDPMLGIRGVHEGDEITVIALLEGPASKPEITLESQPPLPEDEVLSRLLFGKTASSLGPLEAAQLAASASELAGGGSGVDVLGTIRNFVGVDVLEVDTSGDAAAVKAGTYLADGVFVGAKQGAAPGSSSVTVEVEVTPNISVTTESGQTSSNAGVNFKWDY
jgi:translocation and assembly module TamB